MKSRPILLVAAALLVGACSAPVEEPSAEPIAPEQLVERLELGAPPMILDVRTPEEYERGHIPGAVNIPHDQLAARLAELPQDRSEEIVVHCQSGRRAGAADGTLRANGYTNVRDLVGHWQRWEAAGLPVE